ncbi:hypothetical protein niasHT_034553 [Heterodera trifolii]|uniref:DEAD-box helicase OB fold domain-containing protein n=1 Tax=Heterodera trifolii TaxID=157864 RepID=A0ABD2IRS5_9BILA
MSVTSSMRDGKRRGNMTRLRAFLGLWSDGVQRRLQTKDPVVPDEFSPDTHSGALYHHTTWTISCAAASHSFFCESRHQSIRGGLLPFAVTLVSALSVREPLLFISSKKEEETERVRRKSVSDVIKQRFLWSAVGEARLFGDLTVILNTVGAADYEGELTLLLNKSDSVEKLPEKFRMDAPSQEQLRRLRHIMVKCHPDKLAKKVQSMDAPKGAYKTLILEGYVFIDQSSVLHKEQPDYVLYQEIVQMADKKCLRYVASVEPEWISDFVTFSS